MSILDAHRTPPPKKEPARLSLDPAPLGEAFADLVAAKVAEHVAEIQGKADARIQEVMNLGIADVKKLEAEAEAKDRKVAAELADARNRQKEAEIAAQRLAVEKAAAEGAAQAERAAREQIETSLRAEREAVAVLRKPVKDRGDFTALAVRVETAIAAMKPVESKPHGYEFQFHIDGGGNIVGATATPREQ